MKSMVELTGSISPMHRIPRQPMSTVVQAMAASAAECVATIARTTIFTLALARFCTCLDAPIVNRRSLCSGGVVGNRQRRIREFNKYLGTSYPIRSFCLTCIVEIARRWRFETKEKTMSLHEGKVAFITGVARGQGRAHAVKLAQQGMNIIGVDICETIDSMDYPAANEADLAETVRLVEAEDRQIIAHKADVRDAAALEKAVAEGVSQFGRLDVIIANAGFIRLTEGSDPAAVWRDVIDVLLNGVWNTVQAGLPAMLDGGRGGSVVITSSTAGLKGVGKRDAGTQAYAAAKRGVVGLMQVLAKEYAQDWIRVNTIHPTGVYTGMTMNETFRKLFEDAGSMLQGMQNALPVEMLEPTDIANVVSWLVSDEAKYLTGVQLPIDAGMMIR